MTETTIALVVFLFPLAYSPGPGNMFFAANGARFGFRATLWANFGYHISTWLVTFAMGFGFIAAIDQFPQVFGALKIAGSMYVLWIAWNIFQSSTLKGEATARPAGFGDGAILLLFNPKAYVIIALMFAQFLTSSEVGRASAVLLIATVFTVNNFVAFIVWTVAGDAIARQFRTPSSVQRLNFLFGGILAGVAVWMLFS